MLTKSCIALQNPNVATLIKTILKEKMLGKLDEHNPWNYVSAPEGQTKAQVTAKINFFIANKLDDFILACLDVIPYFTESDYLSIGTETLTDNAKKFIALFAYLETNGFPGVDDFHKPINFWSGRQGQLKALNCINEISDSNVPAIVAMYDVCAVIQQYSHCNDTILCCAVSRFFAAHASNNANVYISSPKQSEEPGFTVANYFWLVELPTLMTLKWRGIIKDININLFDNKTQQWQESFSLFSSKGNSIPIRRQFIHPIDAPELADRFVPQCPMTGDQKLKFNASKARPAITYGRLKIIADEWRERTRAHNNCCNNSENNNSKNNDSTPPVAPRRQPRK